MKILDDIQGSDSWLKSRAGLPTASNFSKIITTKGQPSKQRTKYLYQLAAERVTGKKTETYQSAAMTRGIEMEAEARMVFEMEAEVEVEQVGFCLSDCGRYGFSPDGLTETYGLEIKCPESHTHVEYLLGNKLPTTYFQQVQGSLFISGLSSWFFYSYYPDLPPLTVMVFPDEDFHEALADELDRFCDQLDELTNQLRAA